MRVKRMKTLALLVDTCMVLTLCMASFIPTTDAADVFNETQPGYVSRTSFFSFEVLKKHVFY
jgi:hypothetical protein